MEDFEQTQNEIVLYEASDKYRIEVYVKDDTVWLTQEQIALLFGTQRPAITKHLNNIYATEELDRDSTCSILEHMGQDGARTYKTTYYNLDVILSVGYRVNSKNATLFRRWATQTLRNHLLRGYSINQHVRNINNDVRIQLNEHDKRLQHLEKKVDFFVRTSLPPSQGIFFNGQIFDAYHFVADLIRTATKSIILFDNYVDDSVLTLLDKRGIDVTAQIFCKSISSQLTLDIQRHNEQYPAIDISKFQDAHDRFLCIDETVYHFGASLKDLGKKWFAFNKMNITTHLLTEKMGR